jgi:hypothetical protein
MTAGHALLAHALRPLKQWRSKADRTWPARVLDILESRYHLLPRDLLRLGCVRRRLSAGKFTMEYFYIYDRTVSRESNVPVRSYRDLSGNDRLLLFKGFIHPDGSVNLEKVRSAVSPG